MELTRPGFFGGSMGAGKTAGARRLARTCGVASVDMDTYIERREGKKVKEIFAEGGEEGFRAIETDVLRELGAKPDPLLISCGGGVPMREENVAAMRACGTIVLLTARPEVILERVKDSDDRPLLQNRKSVEGISELMEQRRPKYEAAADVTVDTSDLNIEEVCEAVLQQVNH